MDPNSLAPIVGLAGMLALIVKVIDFARLLTNISTTKSSVVTQLLTWVAAVGVVVLYAESQLGDFQIPGMDLLLSETTFPTQVLIGLAIGSTASVAVDWKQAVDSTDSAAKPPLLH
jgi:hypothetical protein